jgi:hypothetical protein
LKASQVCTHVYFRYTPCLTNFTFEFIRRPISPILSPSSKTFVELTLVTWRVKFPGRIYTSLIPGVHGRPPATRTRRSETELRRSVLSSENGFVENSRRTKLERSFGVVGLNKAVRWTQSRKCLHPFCSPHQLWTAMHAAVIISSSSRA